MPDKVKATHTVVKEPRLSVSRLADYMAASEQGKRAIIQSCKYRAKARVLQHNEARGIISNFLVIPNRKLPFLKEKLEAAEARFFEEQFDTDLNDHNCDFIRHFVAGYERLGLPDAEYKTFGVFPALPLHGTTISFRPQAIVARTTRRNSRKIGAVMLRYAKSKACPRGPLTISRRSFFLI